jgi:calcineurin-like phosphoesterase
VKVSPRKAIILHFRRLKIGITDVGMTGSHGGVIGMKSKQVLTRFVTGIPSRYEVAENDLIFNGVMLEVDDQTGRALSIERIARSFEE